MIDPIVTYRYTITMPDRKARWSELINKWLDKDHFDKLYDGNLLYLVSPIYIDHDYYLVQVQLDLEPVTKSFKGTENVFTFVKNFVNNHKNFYFVYTGRYGFHIYSKFVIRTKKMEIAKLRQYILNPMNMKSSYLDEVASIRRMPTIRIGKRPDNNNLAIPIMSSVDFDYIMNSRNETNFHNLISKLKLKKFIETDLMPIENEISYSEYKKIFRMVSSNYIDFIKSI